MGTDIHGVLRTKNYKDEWKYHSLPELFSGRDYDFFAILANVRNGCGFAGVSRYTEPVQSFTDDRGFPEDFECTNDEFPNGDWIGDHSFGYITLAELNHDIDLAHQTVTRTGVVSKEEYLNLNGAAPESWSGEVGGPNIVTVDPSDIDNPLYETMQVYVRIQWEDKPFLEKITALIAWMSSYQHWKDKTGDDVQLIFGFDS